MQSKLLEIFIPLNLSNEDLIAKEISMGITGKTRQVSDINGLGAITFSLNAGLPFSVSYSDSHKTGVSSVSSVNTSPNANGGINYTNTVYAQTNLLTKITQAITNFFASVVSLF